MSNENVPSNAPIAPQEGNTPQNSGSNKQRDASSEETWRTPSDPFPMEITQVALRNDDPDYIPIEQAMVVRRRSKRKAGRNRTEQEVEMDTATSAPERTETSTSAGGSGKKRRGERSKNKLPKETYNVIALDQDGKPVEPPIVRSKFSNACGTLVRTRCPINVKLWETVDDNIKTLLWNELQKYFVFPPGSEVRGRDYALKKMGDRWRQWKSDLNRDYVQKNLPPFTDYGHISQADWDTFVADHTTAEALALRKKMSELAKKNRYPHRLGSSGYAGHVDQWREIEQRFAAAGKPLLVDPMVERSKNWVWARSTGQVSDEGDILFETPDIEEVTTNLQQIVEKERSGQFVLRRERDQLTAALGTAEHSGRLISTYDPKEIDKDKEKFMFSAFRNSEKRKELAHVLSDSQKSVLAAQDEVQYWLSADVPETYEYGKPFLPTYLMNKLPWEMRVMHEWYMKASRKGLGFISVAVLEGTFMSGPNGIFFISFRDLYALYKLDKMDVNLVAAFCLMQFHEADRTGAKVGYVDPTRICKTQHTVELREDCEQLVGKTPEEKEEYVKTLHKRKKLEVATYLAIAMLAHADKDVLMVPYQFTDHYILFLVYPKDQLIISLDPAHYDKETFMEFLTILNLAHKYYRKRGGPEHIPSQKKLSVRIGWPCYKQPPGTNLCGYYVCEMLRVNGRYKTTSNRIPEIPYIAQRFNDTTILNVAADLCRFIRHDVCNARGLFYDNQSELAMDDKFKPLREWEKEHMQ
uniref:Transposon protein, putative, CACTA, En/Spm sub-class n=1 Tax=Oryza sativa subsp. japonica TaxID=39947 RepID=Q2QRK8_ORYSJ|nr:transposon protein, putative, CACTA, En/Spm sub-class [Oryza sativa Japonica Group]